MLDLGDYLISARIDRSYDRSHSTSEQQIGVFSLTEGVQGPRQGESRRSMASRMIQLQESERW